MSSSIRLCRDDFGFRRSAELLRNTVAKELGPLTAA